MAGEAIGEAFVRIRPETSSFRGETTSALTRDLKATEKELGRFTRGAALGTGALHGLGRGVIYASNTIIGGYGLVYAVRKSTEAAKDAQVVQGQLTTAVRDAGIQYGLYRGEIDRALKATEDLGFTSDDTARSYATLIRATGDVTRATKDQQLAANIARATNVSLAQASKAVAQAEAGRVAGLQRLVPGLQKTTSAQKALADATRITAGSAAKYADTFAGSQERLNTAIQETEVTIGRALIPTITRLSGQLSDWLDDSKNQKRIQDDVNTAVKDATTVVHGLATVFRDLKEPVQIANKLLGGFEHTIETIASLYVLKKLGLLRLGIVGIGTAEKATTAVVVEQSAIQATSIAGVGAAAGTAAARVGGLRGSLLKLRGLGPIGVAIAVSLVPKTAKGQSELNRTGLGGLGKIPILGDLFQQDARLGAWFNEGQDELSPREKRLIRAQVKRGNYVTLAQSAELRKAFLAAHQHDPTRTGVTVPGSVSGTALTGLSGLSAMQRNSLALSAAGRTGTQSDDLAALRAQRSLLAKAIATETQRLRNAPTATAAQKYADNLQNLESKDASAFAQIQSIEQQAAAKARARAQAIKAAADAKLRAEMETFANLLSNANEQVKQYALITRRREATQKALEREGARAVGAAAKSIFGGLGLGVGKHGGAAAQSFTLAQLYQEAESEFKLYGSNYGPRGTVLSPQQQRASYSGTVLKGRSQVTVIQNFHAPTRASQAMNDARVAARALN